MKKLFKKGAGFTLIEILLVVSLMGLVGVAIYHTFANGLKIWQRSHQLILEEDTALFLDRISRELRNAVIFSLIGFEGGEHSVKFATRIRTKADARSGREAGAAVSQIGQMEYVYDAGKKGLYQRQANYSQALDHKKGSERLLLNQIGSVDFRYFYLDADGRLEQTKRISRIPAAVLIEVRISDDRSSRSMSKLVNIPVGL